jgi:hypothetical protein
VCLAVGLAGEGVAEWLDGGVGDIRNVTALRVSLVLPILIWRDCLGPEIHGKTDMLDLDVVESCLVRKGLSEASEQYQIRHRHISVTRAMDNSGEATTEQQRQTIPGRYFLIHTKLTLRSLSDNTCCDGVWWSRVRAWCCE